MRLLKLLLILLLVVFPFGELLRFDLGNNIRIKPLDIITGLIALWWIVNQFTTKFEQVKKFWVLLLFPFVCFISLLINSSWLSQGELLASALYLIRWISYLAVFFAIVSVDKTFKKTIIKFLIIDGLIIVVLGFIQYFFFSSLKPFYYLGWDDHMYRMFSVFLDPNYTGGFFVLFLLFASGLFFKKTQELKLNSPKILLSKLFSFQNKELLLLGLLPILTLFALFLTFSRSALLMLFVGTSVFFLLIGRRQLILILLGVLLLFIMIFSSQYGKENVNLFRQASTGARLGNYQTAMQISKENPVIGVGFNTYRYAKERNGIQSNWTNAPSHADAGVDNSFLFVLATTGFVGLIIYILMWGYILKRAFSFYRKNKNIFAVIVISSTLGLFVHALFINSLFFPAIMLWMWLMIGFMESKSL